MSQEKHELEAQSEETHDVGLHDGDQQMKLESSTTITGVKYSGPLPHPSIMMDYKKLDPKIPDVIIQEFQKANDFYREQDRMDLQAQIKAANDKYEALEKDLGDTAKALEKAEGDIANAKKERDELAKELGEAETAGDAQNLWPAFAARALAEFPEACIEVYTADNCHSQ